MPLYFGRTNNASDLKPFFSFKYDDQSGDNRQADSDDKGISPGPVKFRHLQIHPVPSGDQRQW